MPTPSGDLTQGVSINELDGLMYSSHLTDSDEFAIYHYPAGNNDNRRYQTVKIPLSTLISKIGVTVGEGGNLITSYNQGTMVPVKPITSIGANTPFDAGYVLPVNKGGTGTSNGKANGWKNSVPALVDLTKNSENYTNLEWINSESNFDNIVPLEFGVKGALPITHGGTGATSLEGVKQNLEIPKTRRAVYNPSNGVVVPNKTWTQVLTIPLSGHGLYFIVYGGQYGTSSGTSAVGRRFIYMTPDTTVTSAGRYGVSSIGNANLQGIYTNNITSPSTVYLWAYQDSGSSSTFAPYAVVSSIGT